MTKDRILNNISEKHYSNEIEIHEIANSLLADILKLANVDEILSLQHEKSISSINDNDDIETMKSDIWLLKLVSGRPVAVIELKTPLSDGTTSILNHPKVIGNETVLYEYL